MLDFEKIFFSEIFEKALKEEKAFSDYFLINYEQKEDFFEDSNLPQVKICKRKRNKKTSRLKNFGNKTFSKPKARKTVFGQTGLFIAKKIINRYELINPFQWRNFFLLK